MHISGGIARSYEFLAKEKRLYRLIGNAINRIQPGFQRLIRLGDSDDVRWSRGADSAKM